jgi:hypothetical protein
LSPKTLITRSRKHIPDFAAWWYSDMRAHDTWMYKAIYLKGNNRIRAFISPNGFTSAIARWEAVRSVL